jgi:hypothetical protein
LSVPVVLENNGIISFPPLSLDSKGKDGYACFNYVQKSITMKSYIQYILFITCLYIFNQSYSGFFDRLFRHNPYTNIAASITASARKNMQPDLQACKSLEDIENLLRKEENKCLNDIKEKLDVPDLLWDECLAQIQKYKEYCLNTYFKQPNPNKDHSLANVDPELYKKVVHDAKMYGINPDSINIVYDKKRQDENPSCIAFSTGPNFYEDTFIAYRPAQISFIPLNLCASKEDQYEHTPLHEITHQIELHSIQVNLICRTLNKILLSIDFNEKGKLIKALDRNHEKYADLGPIIKFKNSKQVRVLRKIYIDNCISKIQNGEKFTWNQSPEDATRPDACAEMLPWILKIEDIMAQEAKQSPNKTIKS